MQEFEIIAKTFKGLEEVLAQELTELGANNVQLGHRMVSFTGDKRMLYRANFCLRTAVRILKPIAHFQAKNADEVYDAVRKVRWDEFIDLNTTFVVDSVVNSEEFRHSKFVAYKVKDAIVDFFRETTGERPTIRITNPDVRLNIHISDTECTLSLDSSGESLHHRGYRVRTVEAPINEVLAAGLIKMTGWNGESDFIDPFCGFGTFLVEAALIARNIAPGVFRKEYAFEKWKDFDADMLDEIYNDDSAERPFEHMVYGYDLNQSAVDAALANAKSAGVADIVRVERRDFREFTRPESPALMVTNPPYGERLTPPDLLQLYHEVGSRLKHEFVGNDAWIICSRQELFECLGLRHSFKVEVFNGKIDCDFRKFQLFEGRLGKFRAQGGTVKTDEERRLMSDQRRFHHDREDFKRRFEDENHENASFEDDEDLDHDYRLLRRRHRDFEKRRTSRPATASRSEHKGGDFKRDGKRDFKRDGKQGGKKPFGKKPSGKKPFGKSGHKKD